MADRFAPIARSPLSALIAASRGDTPDVAANASANATRLAEIPRLRYIVLRGNAGDADFVQRVRDVLGLELPIAPCSLARGEHGLLLWLSPDEWMFIAGRDWDDDAINEARTEPALQRTLAGTHAHAIDVSGGYTLLRISGPASVVTLRHVGGYDFDALAPGRAIGTMLSSAPVFAFRVDVDAVYVVVRRSLAEYAWTLLLKAGKPHGIIAEAALHPTNPWAIIGTGSAPSIRS